MEVPSFKVFVASPSDVAEERVLAERILSRFALEYSNRVALQIYLWEKEPLLATETYQSQVPSPADFDLVVSIFWWRLGSPLPAHVRHRDGSRAASGTEYELDVALAAHAENGRPEILAYLKTTEPLVSLANPEQVRAQLDQKERLDSFLRKRFEDEERCPSGALHRFETAHAFEQTFAEHIERLLERRFPHAVSGTELARPSWRRGSPYRGLSAFESDHADVFFGRSRVISECMSALRHQSANGRPFLMVVGMSGGGKSSLVRAGILPLLTRPGVIQGVGLWRTCLVRPQDEPGGPLRSMIGGLLHERSLPELGVEGSTREALIRTVRGDPRSLAVLVKAGLAHAATAAGCQPGEARLVLVMDQLEELFPHTEEAGLVLEALAALAEAGDTWVLATLRSDFYAQCALHPTLLALKEGSGQYDLPAPTAAEIGQMIRLPARAAGLRFEESSETGDRLDDVLRDGATRHPESLPLLQFALEELYQRRLPDGLLTFAAYEEIGRLEGALATMAERTFQSLDPREQRCLPHVFRALVSADGEAVERFARRRATMEEFESSPNDRRFVERFAEERLFTTDLDSDHRETVTVAHEALFTHWERLHQWILTEQDLLRIAARVRRGAERWHRENRDPDLLLPGGRPLAEALDLVCEADVELKEPSRSFVAASRAREARRRTLRRLAVAALLVLTVTSTIAAWLAFDRTRVANAKTVEAQMEWKRAEAAHAELLRQADQAFVATLPQDALELVPPTPEIVREMDEWLSRADEVLARCDGYREELAFLLAAEQGGSAREKLEEVLEEERDAERVRLAALSCEDQVGELTDYTKGEFAPLQQLVQVLRETKAVERGLDMPPFFRRARAVLRRTIDAAATSGDGQEILELADVLGTLYAWDGQTESLLVAAESYPLLEDIVSTPEWQSMVALLRATSELREKGRPSESAEASDLRSLLQGMKRLALVRERVVGDREFVSRVVERTVEDERFAWDAAAREIAAMEIYHGLPLEPQVGLVPLGVNPETGLWEFWHVRSGKRPVIEAGGRIEKNPDAGLVLVLIPPGTFRMGAETSYLGLPASLTNYDPVATREMMPVHAVTLAPFFLSRTEVTQAQWSRCAATNPGPSYYGPGTVLGVGIKRTNPVESVSWRDADLWLRHVGLTFPTEAQWEYAARAGSSSVYPTGSELTSLKGYANIADATYGSWERAGRFERELEDGFTLHAPVGSLLGNGFGLFDMIGNVSEPCQDWIVAYEASAPRYGDGLREGLQEASLFDASIGRVYRGGSFASLRHEARSASRVARNEEERTREMGVRPSRQVDASETAYAEWFRAFVEAEGPRRDQLVPPIRKELERLLKRGYTALSGGDFKEISSCFEQALQLAPNSYYFYYLQGQFFERFQRLDDAVSAYERALEKVPEDEGPVIGFILNGLAQALDGKGETSTAIECAKRAVAQDPNTTAYLRTLCQILRKAERWGEAVAQGAALTEQAPDDLQNWTLRARCLHGAGDHAKALEILAEGKRIAQIGSEAEWEDWHYYRSVMLYALERYEEAAKAAADALEYDDRDPRNWLRLAISRVEFGADEEALEAFTSALRYGERLAPDMISWWRYQRGLTLRRLGRDEEALKDLHEASKLDPQDRRYLLEVGATTLALGRVAEARASFDAALDLLPSEDLAERANHLVLVAQQLLASENYTEAQQEYRRAAELLPDDPRVLNSLAWSLVAPSIPAEAWRPVEAQEAAERAAAHTAEPNAFHLNTLGVSLYRAGDYERAAKTLERADQANVELGDAGYARALDLAFIAMCRWRMGVPERAREALRAAESDTRPREREAEAALAEARAMVSAE